MSGSNGKIKTTLYWDRELRDALAGLAAEDGRSLNSYVMRILESHARTRRIIFEDDWPEETMAENIAIDALVKYAKQEYKAGRTIPIEELLERSDEE